MRMLTTAVVGGVVGGQELSFTLSSSPIPESPPPPKSRLCCKSPGRPYKVAWRRGCDDDRAWEEVGS